MDSSPPAPPTTPLQYNTYCNSTSSVIVKLRKAMVELEHCSKIQMNHLNGLIQRKDRINNTLKAQWRTCMEENKQLKAHWSKCVNEIKLLEDRLHKAQWDLELILEAGVSKNGVTPNPKIKRRNARRKTAALSQYLDDPDESDGSVDESDSQARDLDEYDDDDDDDEEVEDEDEASNNDSDYSPPKRKADAEEVEDEETEGDEQGKNSKQQAEDEEPDGDEQADNDKNETAEMKEVEQKECEMVANSSPIF